MTDILDWFTPTRWIILGVVLLALLGSVLGYGEWRAESARKAESQKWELAVGKMQTEAATKLAVQTSKVLTLERQIADDRQKEEIAYENRRHESHAVAQRFDDAVAVGLRDPAQRGCGRDVAKAQGGTGAGGSPADGAEAGGLLSGPLSRLLQRVQREAQEVNDAYATCRGTLINWNKRIEEWSGAEGP